jgi:hypothetical protein
MAKQYQNFKPMTAALTFEQAEALKGLSEKYRISQQELIREAVKDLVQKYAKRRGKR